MFFIISNSDSREQDENGNKSFCWLSFQLFDVCNMKDWHYVNVCCYKIHKILPENGSEIKFSSLNLTKWFNLQVKSICLTRWLWNYVLISSTVPSCCHLFHFLFQAEAIIIYLATDFSTEGNSSDKSLDQDP